MTFFDSEVITVASGDIDVLTAATYDGDPGSGKARRAFITCFTADVAYTLDGEDPDTSTNAYHLLTAGGTPLTIEGYDNIVNFKAKLVSGSTSAKLFVSYAR
jgi:hypothetical protein